MRSQIFIGLVGAALLSSACGDDSPAGTGGAGGSGGSDATTGGTTTSSSSSGTPTSTSSGAGGGQGGDGGGGGEAPAGPFDVRGSVEQVHVWNAEQAGSIELLDAEGEVVETAETDALGSYIFRRVTPGEYSVRQGGDTVGPVTVMSVEGSLPPPEFYSDQVLIPGVNYITTRDGTQLAVYVTLPGPEEDGPYPTVVNYSGYDPAKPGAPIEGYEGLCDIYPVLCDAPADPSALIASLMGYATISVNMRGTGCSGGAYDYFEDLQILDGYDVIEVSAAQSWVLHNHVGMTGLSYPGITQMFVGKTQPPGLAAITPLSVIGGTHSTTRPGGIFNEGFALSWITNVLGKADPYGQGWEQARVDEGDTICEENQLLHGQKVDVIELAENTAYYTEDLVGRVDPSRFAGEIEVPVFFASAWQDEQTGPFFTTLLDRFSSAPVARYNVYNGVHIDGFSPQILVEWKTFLDLYVAEAVPSISSGVRTLAPALFDTIFHQNLPLPPDRFADYDTWEEAKAAFEAEDPVRVLFENGTSAERPGSPEAAFEARFSAWPPAETDPLRLFMQADGSLAEVEPAGTAAFSFAHDPDAGGRGMLAPGGNIWDPLPDYDWPALVDGASVSTISAPLVDDLVMVGTGSADLWVRAPVNDADLEVSITEVRPDGQEMYVQSGWLRASLRALRDDATETWPEPTYLEEDEAMLVPGEWTEVRVAIAGFSHVFRAGSRIRVTIDTPGDTRSEWRFELATFDEPVSYDIGASAERPSSIVLPVIDGLDVETELAPCPSLRGQPCRPFVAYTNTLAAE